MKTMTVSRGRGRAAPVSVPDTWDEGYSMVADQLEKGFSSGSDSTLSSVCERVALGLFGDMFNAPNQRLAMAYLIMRICEREGAGLDHDSKAVRENQSVGG